VHEPGRPVFDCQSLLVLTADEIQDYRISFIGQQQQGDSHLYVFDVSPVGARPGRPQVEGRIWVDSHDLFIVKSYGTIMTRREKKQKGPENLLPAAATRRELIDGRYWFPTYSRANDVLYFSGRDVQIDELVTLTSYKAIEQPK
jgi:hypothetical protein